MMNNLSTLKKIISPCGIESEGHSFIQKQPTKLVLENLRELFSKGNISTFEQIKEILTEIQSDTEDFSAFLSPLKSNYDLYLFTTPKSLCQIFLMISEISNFLINILIDKVCELSQNNVESDNQLAMLCLNQFKWNIYNKNMNEVIEKLLDLGYVANNTVQNYLITIFPDICQGKCTINLAEKLFEWMSSNNNLVGSSLETINKLDLHDNILKETESLVTDMLDSAAMNTLPSIISYLLKRTDKSGQMNLIDKIRLNIEFDNLRSMFSSAISSTPIGYISSESNSAVKLINSIQINLQFNPDLRKSWIKSISQKMSEVRSQNFDLIILLMIFNQYKSETNTIINLIKSKICHGQFTSETIETLFKYHLSVLKPYYRTFLTIINLILISSDQSILQFARFAYLQSFLNPIKQFFAEEDIFECLINDLSVKPKHTIDAILEIVKYLSENCLDKLHQFYWKISDLLSIKIEMTGHQVHQIFSILATIAFPSSESDQHNEFCDDKKLQNQIVLLIRKQLQNPDFITRRNGAIGSVTVMKFLANLTERPNNEPGNVVDYCLVINPNADSQSDVISDDCEISSEPNDGRNRIIGSIIKSIILSYSNTVPELIVVVFDELYRLITLGEMTSVEKEISRIVYNTFQDLFISNLPSLEKDGIAEERENVVFGLVGSDFCDVSVVVSQSKRQCTLVRKIIHNNLPAHFRLLALLKLRIDKNLTTINALLGCPIMLSDTLDKSSPIELLILINWLIEVVNAFSSDITGGEIDNFRSTLVKRMKLIVSQIANLEKILIAQSKTVKFPTIQVSNGSNLVLVTDVKKLTVKRKSGKTNKKAKKSKAKNKGNQNVEQVENEEESVDKEKDFRGEEEEEEELVEFDKEIPAAGQIKCRVLHENLCLCFREFDLSIHSILGDLARSELILSDRVEESLNWDEVKFFLTDLWLKIKHSLRDKTSFLGGFNPQYSSKNVILYRYIDQVPLDVLVENLIGMEDFFKLLLAKCIAICNSNEIFNSYEDTRLQVMELLLQILAKIIHFLKTYSRGNNEISVERFIRNLVPRSSLSFLKYILSVKEKIPNVNIASAYCELISELLSISEISSPNFSLLDLSAKFLGVRWNHDNIANYKSAVSKLFEIHLSFLSNNWFEILSNSVLREMQTLASKDAGDENQNNVYVCLDKHTLLGVFRQISDFIIKKCKSLSKISGSQKHSVDFLKSWEKIVVILKLFTKIVADDRESNMMQCFIKFSRDLVKIVIKDLMPILDNLFRHENTQVVQLLTGIQFFTRFVQRLCSHCKNKNNLSSASLVPQVRRFLETFMFRVKKMMCINKCSGDSINILLLANKDLHGQRIEESIDSDNADGGNADVSGEDLDAFSGDLDNESDLDE